MFLNDKRDIFVSVFLWFWQWIETEKKKRRKEVRQWFGSNGYFCYIPSKMNGIIKTEIYGEQPDGRLLIQEGPSFVWDENVLNHSHMDFGLISSLLELGLFSSSSDFSFEATLKNDSVIHFMAKLIVGLVMQCNYYLKWNFELWIEFERVSNLTK